MSPEQTNSHLHGINHFFQVYGINELIFKHFWLKNKLQEYELSQLCDDFRPGKSTVKRKS